MRGSRCSSSLIPGPEALRREDYETFVLPYVQKIFKAVKLPSIYYLKNCAHLMDLMEKSGADMLSVCETVNIKDIKTKKGIQGNLLNSLLYADDKTIVEETRRILKAAKAKHRKYIFNLKPRRHARCQSAKVQIDR